MKIIILFFIPIFLIGCSTIPQGTAPSSSPLINKSGENLKYQVIGQSIADAGHFSLFGFIPFGRADIDEAIYKAIQKRNGDNLINLCYNVDYVSYFIFGSTTSITVKGDVIKYTSNGQSFDTKSEFFDFDEPSTKLPANHMFRVNVINGLGFNYGLVLPFNDIMFGKITLGYRAYEDEIVSTLNFGGGNTFKYKIDYQFIPLIFSTGVNTEKIFKTDIPVNGIASIGLGYYPDIKRIDANLSGKESGWLNFGWNVGIGAEYKIISNLALGVYYNYHKLFVGEDNIIGIGYWGFYNSEIEKPSFSELGLTLRFIP